jgi:hypothetical protein
MKFKTILKEMAQVEYSDEKGVQVDNEQANALEFSIAKAIGRAFESSEELRNKFKLNHLPYDVQVTKEGSTFKLTFNPEDGSSPESRVYPMSYLAKYINNPKMMASVLLTK